MAEVGEKKKIFKKHSILLVIFQLILIAFSIVLYTQKDTEIGIPNFSMDKLFILFFAFTVVFGIFVLVYLIFGLFRYNIADTIFVEKINYKVLTIIFLIMMIVGAGCFFTQLYLVDWNLAALTWGGFILTVIVLVILGIISFIGIFLIINEIKADLQANK